MLVISCRTFEVYAHQAASDFDRRAFNFLSNHFPELLAVRGNDGLERFVVAGQNRAGLVGCRSEREVILFLTLQAMFGENFDVAPEYAWGTSPLHDTGSSIWTRLVTVYDRLTGGSDGRG